MLKIGLSEMGGLFSVFHSAINLDEKKGVKRALEFWEHGGHNNPSTFILRFYQPRQRF